jgi:3-hydroxyisobutyrate dehydrogenase-like beta-hydroxyacid dehydrogenase
MLFHCVMVSIVLSVIRIELCFRLAVTATSSRRTWILYLFLKAKAAVLCWIGPYWHHQQFPGGEHRLLGISTSRVDAPLHLQRNLTSRYAYTNSGITTDNMASVLVVGLGSMGGAVAKRLLHTGVDVYGYDVNDSAMQRFKDVGGKTSADLAILDNVDVVITSLPNDQILQSFINDNLLERLSSRHTLIEMSTVLPRTMTTIAETLQGRLKDVIDCPVSGGPNEAHQGILSLLVGIEGDTLPPPINDLLSKVGSVNLIGTIGNGKTLKLINNMISMGNTAVFTEAFALGRELGLDPATMYNVLSKSGGSSTMLVKRIPYVLEDDYHARFSVELAEKDTGLALQMAHGVHYPSPILANTHQRYEEAMRRGLGGEDVVALIKLNEKQKN